MTYQANKAAGIQASAEHSGEAWAGYALDSVRNYLRKHPTLFVDDLWDAGLEKPSSPRALGSVMQEAARNGWMEEQRLGGCVLARPSKSSHGQLKRVWRSNLYNRRG